MNERIVELKNQTLDKHFWYTWSTMDYHDVTKFAEKFAELLIRDCANFTDPVTRKLMLKHFGVEE